MKRYPRYKASGIPWLGVVPEHWLIGKLKHASEANPRKGSSDFEKDSDQLVTFLPMERVSENGQIDTSIQKPINELWRGYTYFEEEDVIVAKITPCFENGKAAHLAELGSPVGFGSTEFHVLRSREGVSDGRFLYYLVFSHVFRETGEAFMTGAAGQKRVPTQFVEEFALALPPLSEQQIIAAYLDHKTEQIDTLIEKKQALIELLKEQRTAIINRAVTKGLDPDVPMKDSGIEWLGEVPEHWDVVALKRITEEIVDCKNRTPPYYDNGDYFVVRTSNVRDGKLLMDDALYTDHDGFKEWTRRGTPRPGDLLFTREAPAGECCLVPEDLPLCLGQRMMYIRPEAGVLDVGYLFYAVCSPFVRDYIEATSAGSTVSHVRVGQVYDMPMLLPSLEEQAEIARHLDRITSLIDKIVTREASFVELLRELRTSLISEVVTGKIDVRDKVAELEDASVDEVPAEAVAA